MSTVTRLRWAFAIAALTFGFVLVPGIRLTGPAVWVAFLFSGLGLMALEGKAKLWFPTLLKAMKHKLFLANILPAMGFAEVLDKTGCAQNLMILAKQVPGTLPVVVLAILVTFLLNTVMLSASATALVIGPVALLLLTERGVEPAMAAAVVLCGTWGAVLGVGSGQAALIAMKARVSIGGVIKNHLVAALVGLTVVVGAVSGESLFFRSPPPVTATEHGSVPAALMPLVPAILLIGHAVLTWWLRRRRGRQGVAGNSSGAAKSKRLPVAEVMIVAAALAALVTGTSPAVAGRAFAVGIASGYLNVAMYIVGAMVFVAGLESIGVINAAVARLRENRASVPLAAIGATAAAAAISGTSDAPVTSFNTALIDRASEVGVAPITLGSLVWLGGELGRCMSPTAAATYAVANALGRGSIAPGAVVARTAVPVVLALACIYGILRHRPLPARDAGR
jgi:DcuC family C4-dicarboxylate transporter